MSTNIRHMKNVQPAVVRGNNTHAHGKRFRRFIKKHLNNFQFRRTLRFLLWKANEKDNFDLKRRISMVYSNDSLSGRYVSRYCAYSS